MFDLLLVAACTATKTFFLFATLIFLVEIMPPTQLINAGIEGPLTDDFNFDAHIIVPSALDHYELPLAIRITENLHQPLAVACITVF
jgi:hypothetical protein